MDTKPVWVTTAAVLGLGLMGGSSRKGSRMRRWITPPGASHEDVERYLARPHSFAWILPDGTVRFLNENETHSENVPWEIWSPHQEQWASPSDLVLQSLGWLRLCSIRDMDAAKPPTSEQWEAWFDLVLLAAASSESFNPNATAFLDGNAFAGVAGPWRRNPKSDGFTIPIPSLVKGLFGRQGEARLFSAASSVG